MEFNVLIWNHIENSRKHSAQNIYVPYVPIVVQCTYMDHIENSRKHSSQTTYVPYVSIVVQNYNVLICPYNPLYGSISQYPYN